MPASFLIFVEIINFFDSIVDVWIYYITNREKQGELPAWFLFFIEMIQFFLLFYYLSQNDPNRLTMRSTVNCQPHWWTLSSAEHTPHIWIKLLISKFNYSYCTLTPHIWIKLLISRLSNSYCNLTPHNKFNSSYLNKTPHI